jgi:hypothetical protein
MTSHIMGGTLRDSRGVAERTALVCGILAALLYIAMNAFVPMMDANYSIRSQTVSELSAIGAPTRPLWVWLGVMYALLIVAFGWGVRRVAAGNRALRFTATLLIANGLLDLYWPPMHMRGGVFSLTDTLHIAWTAVTGLLMLLAIGFAGAASGARFRICSIATGLALLVFGALTSVDAPRIPSGAPTPWIGVWERIGIGSFMVWLILFASMLLRREKAATLGGAR